MGIATRIALSLLAIIVCFSCLAIADVSSINSAVITPRVFNDVPGATFTSTNSYPSSILFNESHVSTSTGFANRDLWQFSSDGTTPYQFQNSDYFTASFDLVLTADPLTTRKEAGFILSTTSNGDIAFVVNTDAHEVIEFGGISLYSFTANNGITYNSGQTINLDVSYFLDGNNRNALQFSANGTLSPIFEFAPNVGIGDGSTLGGYLQVVNDPFNPGNTGQAVFSNITIAGITPTSAPEPGSLLLLASGLLLAGCSVRRSVRR